MGDMQTCIGLIVNCPTAYFSAASVMKAGQSVFLIRRRSCQRYSAAGTIKIAARDKICGVLPLLLLAGFCCCGGFNCLKPLLSLARQPGKSGFCCSWIIICGEMLPFLVKADYFSVASVMKAGASVLLIRGQFCRRYSAAGTFFCCAQCLTCRKSGISLKINQRSLGRALPLRRPLRTHIFQKIRPKSAQPRGGDEKAGRNAGGKYHRNGKYSSQTAPA